MPMVNRDRDKIKEIRVHFKELQRRNKSEHSKRQKRVNEQRFAELAKTRPDQKPNCKKTNDRDKRPFF